MAKIAKKYGHIQGIVDRAKTRAIERIVHRLVNPAFAKWKQTVTEWNRAKAEEEADEADRLLLEARDDARRWREAAERGWAAVQRMGHRALRRMINAHLWRAFGHWKKAAQASIALKDYRRKAEARIQELERRLHPLEGEVGALRLFKDAMASSERTMIMRKGGGFIALEDYVATVENRISAAALEEALEGKARGEEMAERYGLSGALDALRGAAQAEHGDVLTPRGGHTSWRHAPQMGAPPKSPARRGHRRGGGGGGGGGLGAGATRAAAGGATAATTTTTAAAAAAAATLDATSLVRRQRRISAASAVYLDDRTAPDTPRVGGNARTSLPRIPTTSPSR